MDDQPLFTRRADFGARILVVDDDPLARRSIRAMLERSYYQVETAEDGAEALGLLSACLPDLVLLDIQMPGVDGLEVCRGIRAMPRGDRLPIIFLTAEERSDIHTLAFQAGGDDFLRKPVLMAELIVRIRSLMRLKRLQAEVLEERDNLLDLHKQREQLFGFIVHDLKNPLSAIQAGLELLGDRDDCPAAAQAQVRRLRETALTMGRMVQNILDIGRAEELGLELRKTRIALDSWLPELLQELESRAQSRRLALAVECPRELQVEADQDFLRRLMLNLLDNALKYAPSGSCISINAQATASGVRLEVRDEGDGIPESQRDQVFGKFVRLEENPAGARSGSGLGLAFCRLVAEAHDGRIWVESNQPKGSIFKLELPVS